MQQEVKSEVQVTVNRPVKVIHYCDGIDEIVEEENYNDLNSNPKNESVNPKSLPWLPWFSHYAWKSGSNALYYLDYAGEGLANFFGITTPKYQIEINEYERLQEEKRKMEEESAGWVPTNVGGDIPLVLNEPLKNDKNQTTNNNITN